MISSLTYFYQPEGSPFSVAQDLSTDNQRQRACKELQELLSLGPEDTLQFRKENGKVRIIVYNAMAPLGAKIPLEEDYAHHHELARYLLGLSEYPTRTSSLPLVDDRKPLERDRVALPNSEMEQLKERIRVLEKSLQQATAKRKNSPLQPISNRHLRSLASSRGRASSLLVESTDDSDSESDYQSVHSSLTNSNGSDQDSPQIQRRAPLRRKAEKSDKTVRRLLENQREMFTQFRQLIEAQNTQQQANEERWTAFTERLINHLAPPTENRKEELRQEEAALHQQNESLLEQISQQNQAIEGLKHDNRSQRELLQEQNDQISELTTRITNLHLAQAGLQDQVVQVNEAATRSLQEQQQIFIEHIERISTYNQQQLQEQQQLNSQLRDQAREALQGIRQLQTDLYRAQEEVKQSKIQTATDQEIIVKQGTEISHLQNQQSEIQTLAQNQVKIAQMEKTLQEWETAFSVKNQEIENLRDQAQEISTKYAELQQAYNQQQSVYEQQKSAYIDELENHQRTVSEQTVQQQKLHRMEANLETIKADLTTHKDLLNQKEEAYQALLQQQLRALQEQNREMEDLRTELKQKNQELEAQRIATLAYEKAFNVLKQKLETTQEACDLLEQERAINRHQLHAAAQSVEVTLDREREALEESRRLLGIIEELQAEKQSLFSQNEELINKSEEESRQALEELSPVLTPFSLSPSLSPIGHESQDVFLASPTDNNNDRQEDTLLQRSAPLPVREISPASSEDERAQSNPSPQPASSPVLTQPAFTPQSSPVQPNRSLGDHPSSTEIDRNEIEEKHNTPTPERKRKETYWSTVMHLRPNGQNGDTSSERRRVVALETVSPTAVVSTSQQISQQRQLSGTKPQSRRIHITF